jgi:hypothetical protein
MVPVLSSTTAEMRSADSRAAPSRTRIPASAPFPVPTMIAVGVARPMAHGQAMISTAIAADRANGSRGSGPTSIQPAKASRARATTTGTNQPVTASATRWMGALEPCACSTSRTICDSVVSRPTRSARITKLPDAFMVAPMTRSPAPRSTGIDSPVSIDSSSADAPSTITPSTGTRSPGRTRSRSPARTWSSGTSCSRPSRSTRAVAGRSFSRAPTAPAAWPLARASSQRPKSTRPMMTAALS